MLNLLRIGTGLAVVLAIVSVNLWSNLRTERALTAELQAQLTNSAIRSSGPALLPQRNESPSDAVAPTPGTSGANPESPRPTLAPPSVVNVIQNSFSPERDLMKDPEYRKARFTQARMNLKRYYTDVSEELGLSERETEQLFDLLAERELGSSGAITIGADGQPDRQAMDEMRRARDAGLRKQDEALAALIGPDRQSKWQEYQLSLSARNRAVSMTTMLAASGQPLTEAQRKPLTAALIAEERYVRQQQSTNRPTAQESLAQRQEESVNRQEESNRRYLEAAAPYMSSQQLALVRQTLEQQIIISRANARMQRERMEALPPGSQPPRGQF